MVQSGVGIEEAAVALLSGAVRRGAEARLEIRGACMAPFLRPGDQVGVARAEPLPGRLAVARTTAGELVCHRVVRRDEGGYLLAGDRSAEREEHPPSSVVGVVLWAARDGRRLRFDGAAGRLVDRMLALIPRRVPRRPWAAVRRVLLYVRGFAWHWATAERVQSPALRSAATSSRTLPASSR